MTTTPETPAPETPASDTAPPETADRRPLFSPPRLRVGSGADEARHATWLELLYDLAYVAAVAALADTVVTRLTWPHVLATAALFVPVWWSWVGHAFYANRFDTDDVAQRLVTAALLICAVGLAAGVPQAEHGSAMFAGSYIAARLTLIAAYARAFRHVPAARALIGRYVAGFAAAAALWAVSLVLPGHQRPVIWAVATAIDLATPPLARRFQGQLPPQPMHIPERFGLFFVIVLGEVVASVAYALSHVAHLSAGAVGSALAALTIVVGWWFTYFDGMDRDVIRRWAAAGQVWMFVHPVLYISVAFAGAAVEALIVHPTTGAVGLAAGSIATAWLALAAIAACSRRDRLTAVRAAAATVIAVVGAFAGALPVAAVLLVAAGVSVAAGLAHLVLPLGFTPADFSD